MLAVAGSRNLEVELVKAGSLEAGAQTSQLLVLEHASIVDLGKHNVLDDMERSTVCWWQLQHGSLLFAFAQSELVCGRSCGLTSNEKCSFQKHVLKVRV